MYMSTPSQLYHLVGRRRFEEDGSSFGEISVSFGNNSGRFDFLAELIVLFLYP